MIKEEYIRELHDRNYSLYASPRLEKQALDELHEQDYMIFDLDETFNLYEDYEKELKAQNQAPQENRLNDMSGVFLSKDSVAPVINAIKTNSVTPSVSSATLNHAKSGILLKEKKLSAEKKYQDCRKTELHGVLDSLISFKKNGAIELLKTNVKKENAGQLLYFRLNGGAYRYCEAIGSYENSTNRFTVKAGSIIVGNVLPRFEGTDKKRKRDAFIAMSCEKRYNGYVILKDVLFNTPSEATFIVAGISVSGWDSWKNKNGQTMRELYKQ